MTTAYRIEIEQTAITAPHFPRNADWWRGYLPLWFMDSRWWEKSETDWDRGAVSVDDATGTVRISAENRRHANRITEWLLGSVLATRYMTDPDIHVRLLVTSTATSNKRQEI